MTYSARSSRSGSHLSSHSMGSTLARTKSRLLMCVPRSNRRKLRNFREVKADCQPYQKKPNQPQVKQQEVPRQEVRQVSARTSSISGPTRSTTARRVSLSASSRVTQRGTASSGMKIFDWHRYLLEKLVEHHRWMDSSRFIERF